MIPEGEVRSRATVRPTMQANSPSVRSSEKNKRPPSTSLNQVNHSADL